MTTTRWHQRFYDTTRGRVLWLLRRENRTVDDLASEIGVTDNAVRSHLAALERDGLIAQRALRRGKGKPAILYGLTEHAESLFPKAYGAVLHQLLDVLVEREEPDEIEHVLRKVGRRLAAARGPQAGDLEQRLRAAIDAIQELGGSAELIEREGADMVIQGYGCPLAGTVVDHPEVCHLVESLLEELTGVSIREDCERGEPPRCRFHVGPGVDPPPVLP